MQFFVDLRVSTKLQLITALAALAILAVAATLLAADYTALIEARKATTRTVVESAHSVVEHHYRLARSGAVSEDEARRQAIAALRALRYGDKDYVWINDLRPYVVMHPVKPELDGKDAGGIRDPLGKPLFQRFVDVVKATGAGYVDYLWPKPGFDEPVRKVSYVKGFAPWGWVIGSGLYVDDIDRAFRADVAKALGLAAFAIALFTVVAMAIGRGITRRLRHAVEIARTVSAGDLTTQITVDTRDETGQLLEALRDMNASLARIVAEVRVGTGAIGTASHEIALGNADLSSRTEQQASSLEETASSMEELTSTVKQNADNARQANQLAAGASEVAVKGGAVVGEVVHTMTSINESSKKIADIIGVIDGIAFQTNILALNAAVEAARAGEQGRGFAVVAAEVRSLAQRSAAAAKEIKQLITASVTQVDDGTRLVSEAGRTMDEIVAAVQRVADIMAEISAASQEQSSGIEQVNQAVAQMDEVTQQNAALVEEASAAAESLKEQTDGLLRAVGVFRVDAAVAAATPRTTSAKVVALPARAHDGGGAAPGRELGRGKRRHVA